MERIDDIDRSPMQRVYPTTGAIAKSTVEERKVQTLYKGIFWSTSDEERYVQPSTGAGRQMPTSNSSRGSSVGSSLVW